MWVTWIEKGERRKHSACTLDVSRTGARIASIEAIPEPGQLIAIRRKTSEARFRVVWIGPAGTPYEGQIGVECVEADKLIWDIDFEDAHEDFEPIGWVRTSSSLSQSLPGNKPIPTYVCSGIVRLCETQPGSEDKVVPLKAIGLSRLELETAPAIAYKGEILVQVNTEEVQLSLTGVIHEQDVGAVCVEFQRIRRGDRRVLQALVTRLSARKR